MDGNGSAGGAASGIIGAVLVLVLLVLYFLPTVVAIGRKHHQIAPVVLVNLFLGWTFIGWIVAMVIAASAKRQPVVAQYFGAPGYPPGYPPGYAPQGYAPGYQAGYPQPGWGPPAPGEQPGLAPGPGEPAG
ncbi:MAG: hypothetical protein QOE45_2851 [Frankiaceae bacterium]|jgi:hypothetical protein|nr:hypothetical protein [Frankiaceae bacterium]